MNFCYRYIFEDRCLNRVVLQVEANTELDAKLAYERVMGKDPDLAGINIRRVHPRTGEPA